MIAGTDSAIRKIATPASSASTVTPAITAALEKILSPGRRLPPLAEARICPAWSWCRCGLPCSDRLGPGPRAWREASVRQSSA